MPAVAGAGPVDVSNPPQGRFSDDWAEVYLAGEKVGYSNSTMAREAKLIHTGMTLHLELTRASQPMTIRSVQRTTETLDAAPLSFEYTTEMSVMKSVMKGAVKDGKVAIVQSQYGMERTQTFDFPQGALMTWGMFRESLLRGFKPGTRYTLSVYEPGLRLDGPVKLTTTIGDWEDLEHRGRPLRGQKVTMLMESPIGTMELLSWVDKDGIPLKAKVPIPGLGDVEIVTTDQATALADFVPPELFTTTVIKANRKIEPGSARKIKYRITAKSDDVDLSELPTAGMQTIGKCPGRCTDVIVVRQSHTPSAGGDGRSLVPNMAEFLEGNLMINTDDPKLIELARRAAGGEAEPFALADRLRRFVTDYVTTKNLDIGFATASEVGRTREGDCSEHGVLLAALGRLNKLPSRVVVGVVYLPALDGQHGVFGYHMWTQFFIDGRWIDFDAALRESQCSPTRIAFATSSLKNAGMADLSLPLLSKIGGIDIDILEIETVTPAD